MFMLCGSAKGKKKKKRAGQKPNGERKTKRASDGCEKKFVESGRK
jgi:hypothetical protein